MAYQTVNIGDVTKAILADQVTTGSSYVQAIKLVDGTADSETPLIVVAGSQALLPMGLFDGAGNQMTFPLPVELTASPTIGTAACEVLDSLHTTVMTFSGAASANGGTGRVLGARLVCKHDTFAGIIYLHLFRKSVTGTAANAILAVSDADKLEMVGSLKFDFSAAPALGGGRVQTADRANLPMDYKCDAGVDDLFGILQLGTTTPTFAASDLVPFLSLQAD